MSYTLVTGASEGIGKELARCAAKDGHDLILTARSEDKLAALATELSEAHGIEAVVIPADLSKLEDSARLWEQATRGRQIAVLVNNAGLGRNGAFAEGGWDRELATINVNLLTATDLMKRAVAHMSEHGAGRILNVASTAGFMPGPGMAVYHATKSYMLHLSEAVSEELRGSGVSITALCPGPTQTEFFAEADMGNVRLVKMGVIASAADVAEGGWKAMKRGKRVLVPGLMNKLFAFAPRMVPRSMILMVAKLVMGRTH